LDGVAIRVPTPNVSAVDLTFEAGRSTDAAEILALMQTAAAGPLKGVLDVVKAPLVSSDFNHDAHSSVFHADQTLIMGGDMVRVLSWYDNEWAFSNRMADTAVAMGKLI
jgi:glyceraldehyde 3-phosphate dehydrogenase